MLRAALLRSLTFVSSLLLITFTAALAQDTQLLQSAPLAVSPAALLELSKTVAKTPGCHYTYLLNDLSYSIDDAGRVTTHYHTIYRMETPEAAKGGATISATWEPWRQIQPVVRARVITPDGVEHVLDAKTLSDSPNKQGESDVFSDGRIYHGPLPATAQGAIVEEAIDLRDTEPLVPGGTLARIYLGGRNPVMQTRVVIEAPAGKLKYELRTLPEGKITREETGGRSKLTLQFGRIEPVDNVDTNLPSDVSIWPHVEYSTAPSWKQVADSYRALSDQQIRPTEVQALVRETLGANDTREQKIRKLVALLHKEVRYTGIEFGRSSIVPQPAAEVLQRKYGDCKDKAATLISLLRAAGIPAYMALLHPGTGFDLSPSLAGANLFSHAIVFIPGKPDLWVDATSEFSIPGELPVDDQGRYALVIREGTSELVRTPSATSRSNLLIENREYRLAEFGPATIIESSESHGNIDLSYRSYYGHNSATKQLQKEIEDYAKEAYAVQGETKLEISDGLDLTRPFLFRIEATKAKRGYTSLQDAQAALVLAPIVARLPNYFRLTDEDIEKENARSERPRLPRTADFVLTAPFITEWHCKIIPPPGFKARSLPENKTQKMGPALLTQEWKLESDGSVSAVIRFDTQRARYSPAEANELRKAVVELRKANAILVSFDQIGYSLLSNGDGKAALREFDALIHLHPTEAIHHTQLAIALLEVGIGESARTEAEAAVRLEPTSAKAHEELGWVLEHDLIGRRFAKGCELERALTEYRKAVELAPDDNDIRANLAILMEYDKDGERYGVHAHMDEAIEQYRKLKEKKYEWEYLDGNLISVLFWAEKWKDTEIQIATVSSRPDYNAMLVAARTMLEGPEAGLRRAAELTPNEKDKAAAISSAATKLMLLRHYPEAAALLAKVKSEDSNLEMLTAVQNTHRFEELAKPSDDALGTVRKALSLLIGGSHPDPKAAEFFVLMRKGDGKLVPIGPNELRHLASDVRNTAGAGFPVDARGDIVLSNIKLTSEGDDQIGYRVMLQMRELNGKPVYVVKTAEGYRLLPPGNHALARVILQKLHDGNLEAAQRWLEWTREENPIQGGDDPLAGSPFGHLWRRGQRGDKNTMMVAAASIAQGKDVEEYLPILTAALERAGGDKPYVDMTLVSAYGDLERWTEVLPFATDLLKAYPDSDTAFALYAYTCIKTKHYNELEQAAKERKERYPDDEISLMMSAEAANYTPGGYERSLVILRPRITNPKASASILNNYAWNCLFASTVPSDMVEVAQRAARVTDNRNFSIVHTLSAVYAETGRQAEARKLLLKVMEDSGMDEPNPAAWYVFGRIAEQYGRLDAARAAYQRVRDPDSAEFTPTSTWSLALLRAKVMGVKLEESPAAKAGQTN